MNRLFALPTNATVAHLSDIFQGVNFTVNWDALGVEIATSAQEIIPMEAAVYQALPAGLNVWYDSNKGHSSLIMPLIPSPEMLARHQSIGDAWGRKFIPYLTLGPDPVLRRQRRSLLNSLATRLVDYPPLLEFHSELVVVDDSVVPANADFHDDILKNGIVPVTTFIEGTG